MGRKIYVELKEQKEEQAYLILFSVVLLVLMAISNILFYKDKGFTNNGLTIFLFAIVPTTALAISAIVANLVIFVLPSISATIVASTTNNKNYKMASIVVTLQRRVYTRQLF